MKPRKNDATIEHEIDTMIVQVWGKPWHQMTAEEKERVIDDLVAEDRRLQGIKIVREK